MVPDRVDRHAGVGGDFLRRAPLGDESQHLDLALGQRRAGSQLAAVLQGGECVAVSAGTDDGRRDQIRGSLGCSNGISIPADALKLNEGSTSGTTMQTTRT